MRIVITEDDLTQMEYFRSGLEASFRDLTIISLHTEKEFRRALEQFASTPPDIIILDIMLKWTEPGIDQEIAPPDVRAGKFHRAGFRCQRMLESAEKTRDIPVILYSVVDRDEFADERAHLPHNVRLIPKEGALSNLIVCICDMVPRAESLRIVVEQGEAAGRG